MDVRLGYVYKDHCGLCTYFKPRFLKMASENGWDTYDVYVPDHMEDLVKKGVTQTPSILVYIDNEYKGLISGVVRESTIKEFINTNS